MRYKERIIEHNLHRPREYHTDSLKLQEVDFDSSVISHHPKSFEYYFTHGLVVNDRRYIVKEFFVKHGKLYAILTEDEDTYYEMYLSFLDENVIEDLKKDISDLKAKDKQFDKRLSDLENARKQNQTLSINDRTISISGGNSIELPADKDTIYDDTALKQRVKTLEDKPDKADQTLSINDRTISISGGNSIELPADKDTIYDDTALKQRVKNLEDKPDKDDQTLSINDRTISISNGNSIELPADKDTKYTVKGSGLIMDPDNSIRLDAKQFYSFDRHIDYNVYPKLNNLNLLKLSNDIRFSGGTPNILAGNNNYQINAKADRRSGLVYRIENFIDLVVKYRNDDEYGKDSGTITKTILNNHASVVSAGLLDYKYIISDYIYIQVQQAYDIGNGTDKLTFGYVMDLVFTPESGDSVHTYTKPIEYNELDSKEPIIISVMDGSKEKYYVEVVINSMAIDISSVDSYTGFKASDRDTYLNYGGIDE